MAKLSTSCKALAGALAEACPTQQLKSLTADGEGQICLQLADADEKRVVVNFVFFDPDEYPRSGVLVQVDEDKSKCSSAVVEKLGALSERFQDGAQLWAAIAKVCGVLDIPVDEDVLRASDRQAGGAADDGDAGSGSAMEEDASDDPMSEDYPASSGDDDDDGGAFDGLMDDQEEKELMVMCGQRQGCWRRHEDEVAAQAEQGSKQKAAGQPVLSKEQDKAQKQQIFSSEEAFKMLSNELLGFIRRQYTGEDANVSADSAGDDVYTWNVELWKSAFRPDCQLAKDLQEVSSKFAVSSIQLRFTFMRRLHPFFPPRVEVVRPHLSTPLPGALASYPLLRLEHWHPTLTMTQVVDNLRTFLEDHGRIDVHDPRNSLAHSPSSAFSPVQLGLSRLEAVVDVKPACYRRFRELYEARSTQGRPLESTEALESPSSTQQAKKPRTAGQQPPPAAVAAAAASGSAASAASGAAGDASTAGTAGAAAAAAAAAGIVWAKGTGYGSGHRRGPADPVWDAKAAAAAQEAHDEQLHNILEDLAAALRAEFPSSSSAEPTAGAGADAQPPPAAAAAASSSSQQQGPGSASPALTQQQQDCIAAIHDSVLQPLLAKEFSQVAFSELADRHSYFHPLLSVALALCHPTLLPLLAENALAGDPDTAAAAAGSKGSAAQQQTQRVCSIAGAVRGLQKGAIIVKKQLTKALEQRQAAASSSSGKNFATHAEEAARQQSQRSLAIADLLLDITATAQHLKTAEEAAAEAAAAAPAAAGRAGPALPARRVTRATAAQAGAAAAGGGAAAAAAAAEQQQQQQALPEAYKAALKPFVMDTAQIAAFHKHKTDAGNDPSGLKARVHKVTSEIAGIERLIEVNESSSIFVRVDEDNTFLWRALITGPEDTPYSGGCFIFDMFFPPNYPTVPPKVEIITTGNGSVRFNPNLYNCGKVCLSLLGTWSGGQGESWDAQASSAFQVLVSIQSLILVPEPYFNEPGYEARGNHAASQQYNEVIREATIKWAMIEQLARPPPEFADVIKTHFKLRGPYILKQIDGWISEAAAKPAHKGRLEALKGTLQTELSKLA